MPHHGEYEHVKEWLQDHDSDVVDELPPVQNTWYEVFHAYDVRHLWCVTRQDNTETAAKDIEVRWTIDGNVYMFTQSQADAAIWYWYRGHLPSAGGTGGLVAINAVWNAGGNVDKRGLDYKVEVRITSALGTNQHLRCWCVRETLEET